MPNAGFLLEIPGIYQVETAGVADLVIHDRDFPMEPKIGPHFEHTQEAHRKGKGHFNAPGLEPLRHAALQESGAPHGIKQHPAGHTATGRPDEGFPHLVRHTAFSPDIKLQMTEPGGPVNVADNGAENRFGGIEQ